MTYTAPHSLGSNLGNEVVWWSTAWRDANSGRSGVEIRKNRIGHHNAAEVTHPGRNGWHFHRHLCNYYDDEPNVERLRNIWMDSLIRNGRYTPDCDERAFDVRELDAGGAGYISKLSLEVTSGVNKTASNTPLRMLINDFESPGSEHGRLFAEAAFTLSALKVGSVRWSPRLRQKLGVDAPVDDADAAQEDLEQSEVLLGLLSISQWKMIIAANLEESLIEAAQQGEMFVNALLKSEGIGVLTEVSNEAAELAQNKVLNRQHGKSTT